jgi:hypothetical protein
MNKFKVLAILILLIITILVVTLVAKLIEVNKVPCAYLATLTDEKDVILYDEDGNEIMTFKGDDDYENPAILLKKPKKKNELYQVVVLEETGELVTGYIKGKYFNKKITKIKDYDITERNW